MSSPILQPFCCQNSTSGLFSTSEEVKQTVTDTFFSFNVACTVSSTIGILGAVFQLWKRVPRCCGVVKTPDFALLLLVQNNTLGCLALADLLASVGVLARSCVWLAGLQPEFNGGCFLRNILCALLSGWIEFFFLCSYLWTLMLAINMNYMSRDPAHQRSYMWLYHVFTWPLALVLCSAGLVPLYWPNISSCVEHPRFVLPNYLATYIPLTFVMIMTAAVYASSVKHVIRTNISGYRDMTDRDRRLACRVREQFFSFVLVFYICWLPNFACFVLLLLPSFYSKVFIAVWHLMAVLNPLQGFLNCLAYRRVSVRWPVVPAEQLSPYAPDVTSDPYTVNHSAVDNNDSTILIFGDS